MSEVTDEEVNEIAEWLESLSMVQLMFIKKSYEALLQLRSTETGNMYVQ